MQQKQIIALSGAAKLIVCIAQIVLQPVWTSGNFQEFTI